VKVKHWLALILILVAVLFLYHNYSAHGGVAGIKQGIGLGGH